ncbi:MAG: hypothetical protein E6579_15565, partial [Clostridium sp.]|nr:hypothetical protein [Clostridium sp.]
HSPENLIWLKILRMPRNIWTSAIFMPLCQQLQNTAPLTQSKTGAILYDKYAMIGSDPGN